MLGRLLDSSLSLLKSRNENRTLHSKPATRVSVLGVHRPTVLEIVSVGSDSPQQRPVERTGGTVGCCWIGRCAMATRRCGRNGDAARQLSEWALSKFPRCSPIIPFLRGTQAVEQELERLQNDANEPPPFAGRLRQLAAVRWYFQSMLTACGRAWYGQSRAFCSISRPSHKVRPPAHRN